MRLSGLLLLPAGFVIVLAALVLFPQGGLRWGFALAGACIEAGGLTLASMGMRRPMETAE